MVTDMSRHVTSGTSRDAPVTGMGLGATLGSLTSTLTSVGAVLVFAPGPIRKYQAPARTMIDAMTPRMRPVLDPPSLTTIVLVLIGHVTGTLRSMATRGRAKQKASPVEPEADGARHCKRGYIGITAVGGSDARRPIRARDGLRRPVWALAEDELDLIDRTEEVRIETGGNAGAGHRTIIWAVVDGDGVRPLVARRRCPMVSGGLVQPVVALHVDGRACRQQPCRRTTPIRGAHLGRLWSASTSNDPATPRMVRPEVLDLTFRLDEQDARAGPYHRR